jgi:hypothetical protein
MEHQNHHGDKANSFVRPVLSAPHLRYGSQRLLENLAMKLALAVWGGLDRCRYAAGEI